jgi:hypothetical protein
MMEQHKLTGSWLFLQTTFVVSLKATGEKESTTLEVNGFGGPYGGSRKGFPARRT